jgi:hypothetical protein
MFHEGQLVTSIGDGSDGTPLGSHGRVLVLANAAAGHVQWTSGPRAGEVSFIASLEDTVAPLPVGARQAALGSDLLEDSLEYGSIHRTGAQHALATGGYAACFQALASSGAFTDMGSVAEEALAYVEGHLRRSASLHQYLADLDEDDQQEIYRMASRRLITEVLGGYGD